MYVTTLDLPNADSENIIDAVNQMYHELKNTNCQILELETDLDRLRKENEALKRQNNALIKAKRLRSNIPKTENKSMQEEPTRIQRTKREQIIPNGIGLPKVIRIDIDGGFFNKKTRAIIQMPNGFTVSRKLADFKWFHKMLQINNNGTDVPVLPKELPHGLWPNNYLRQRRDELNGFLKQCHRISGVHNSNLFDIFLEQNKKMWKKRRNAFDKKILMKMRQ